MSRSFSAGPTGSRLINRPESGEELTVKFITVAVTGSLEQSSLLSRPVPAVANPSILSSQADRKTPPRSRRNHPRRCTVQEAHVKRDEIVVLTLGIDVRRQFVELSVDPTRRLSRLMVLEEDSHEESIPAV